MTKEVTDTGLSRTSPFLFTCGRCSSCCHNQKIQVNPYEIARMASCIDVSTTEFINGYTEKGVYLKRRVDGRCIFVGADGCGIHPHRPMVCRLYPLGRTVDTSGTETFSVVATPSWCKGTFEKSGTIASYLDLAGLAPYMQAADRYLKLFEKLALTVKKDILNGNMEHPPASMLVTPGRDLPEGYPALLDIDGLLRETAAVEEKPPRSPDDKMLLHIRLLEEWLAQYKKGDKK